jgi:hypothetical protein
MEGALDRALEVANLAAYHCEGQPLLAAHLNIAHLNIAHLNIAH